MGRANFSNFNRNKQALALNLKAQRGMGNHPQSSQEI